MRGEWDLGNDTLYNVVEVLEEHQIKVLELEADLSFSGLSTIVGGKVPVIVLNTSNCPTDRLRFTALHELGHLLLNITHFPLKEQEAFCNAFAGAILISKEKIRSELGGYRHKIFLNELVLIKEQYGISMQAIVYRAKQLELISQSHFKKLMMQFGAMGLRKKEWGEYRKEEKSSRFTQLLLRGVAAVSYTHLRAHETS